MMNSRQWGRAKAGWPARAAATVAMALAAPAAWGAPAPVRTVIVADPASWVLPPPLIAAASPTTDAALAAIYSDAQYLAGPDGMQAYNAVRYRITKPQGLAAGNITLTWSPDSGSMVLHHLRVIHGGAVRDLTRTAQFTVMQREQNLELAALDGRLTAAYQIPGLEVGDEIELATTQTVKDPTLPDARGDLYLLPQASATGTFRLRVAWPHGQPLRWQTTPDLSLQPFAGGKLDGIGVELHDPAPPADVPQGAPPRYRWRRLVEFTNYPSWPDFSRRLFPLYDKAARLAPGSPVQAEVARIAAASTDPVQRAEAALRLVEEQVRYVYVGMDGANLTPADADVTWQRRFGDCKGKTVLLLALLRGLGIEAQPLLIQSRGGDGLADRLPNPALFDHVVVRAIIAGKPVLLDGTRLGDRSLAMILPPPWRQGLPITREGAAILSLPTPPPTLPRLVAVLDIDDSAGMNARAKVRARHIVRGDEALAIRSYLSGLPAVDAERALRKYWQAQENWLVTDKVAWETDEAHGALVLSAQGLGDVDWEDLGDGTHRYTLPGAGFAPPDRLRRPADQDQTLPYETDYPVFRCWVTTVRLPPSGDTRMWRYHAAPVDRSLGGVAYWRQVGLTGNVMRTVMSRRVLLPEITAQQAADLNRQIPGFDNDMSSVYEQATFKGAARPKDDPAPFADDTDWLAARTPCSGR
ncbi:MULTISPECIES: DUF3857 domain-containing protein [unclassified Novosphingobium]|uniref:DUF3857 domain-containing protein n=1 Tax=unclassified Novosphingobium TaxID=2644732 RepID=UPI00146B30BE|nr:MULTISPECIES: DUF3857 domain-containing protein [unclassified Novosphingobium]NMN07098.1 hypothetical protein [Novosphingobium sp. SG919]NMN89314.1 hypothetical protein [Novosphingobium sp. SG916]